MTEHLEIYHCKICGNVIQVLSEGAGELVCCGEPMELLEAKYDENELGEKHVPQIVTEHEGCETGMCREVKYIRLDKHPMTKEHYIQFIQAVSKDKKCIHTKFLSPEERAEFDITNFGDSLDSFEYCNIHGLWRGKND